MKYAINPQMYGAMFAVPCAIAEQYIRLSSELQLKVLLLFLHRGPSEQIENTIAETLRVQPADVEDALNYWVQCGVLINMQKAVTPPAQPQPETKQRSTVKVAAPVKKPSREDTIKRGAESKEIQFMFSEVQMKLGRLVTQAEMSTLVWLHDNQGLSVPVILMAVEYAVSEGKTGFSYIEKLCLDWVKNGVDSLSAAEQRITALYQSKTAWKICENAFGISHRKATARELAYSDKWINSWGFSKDMLVQAYDRCVNSTTKLSFAYIDKILGKWHQNGINKPDQIEQAETKPSKSATRSRSYDLHAIEQQFNKFD